MPGKFVICTTFNDNILIFADSFRGASAVVTNKTLPVYRTLILIFLTLGSAFGNLKATGDERESKIAHAVRSSESPKMDGRLDDAVWQTADVFTGFKEFEPNNGVPASFRTEVRMLYTDQGLYVAARLFDPQPSEISRQLGPRDAGEDVNADQFGIALDTYDDDQNAFVFQVSASGVQTDMRLSQLGADEVWDAVWRSEVEVNAEGWSVEMEIPYSAIRFPERPVQTWGFQMRRVVRRTRQTFTWNYQDRAVDGDVNQFGELQGIENVDPPIRLSLTPYVSGYVQRYSPGKNGTSSASSSRSFNAGADLKYGLSDGYTLDMTLVPDFGQVVSDNQVLNLSPFEVQFQENRPFFTEGTELFNIANVFYSRRVGGRPLGFFTAYDSLQEGEEVVENPGNSRLINAFKISGRSKKKTGLGIFNAMTSASEAIIRDEDGNERSLQTQPFTNYNVMVADQSISNNSYVSLINTNRIAASGYMANVTAGRLRLADQGNRWFVEGNAAVSQKWDDVAQGGVDLGHKYYYRAGKASGNFTFDVGQNVESDRYNPNDMGFLMSPNEFTDFGRVAYNIYKPFWKLAGQFNSLSFRRSSLYKPYLYQSVNLNWESWFQFKSFDFCGVYAWTSPGKRRDSFEPRVEGRHMNLPAVSGFGGFLSTNYARRWALDLRYGQWFQPGFNAYGHEISIEPRFRVNDRLQFEHDLDMDFQNNIRGFVTFDSLDNSLIGTRDRVNIVNTFTTNFAFSSKINLNFRARHYWSRVSYDAFEVLLESGDLGPTVHEENENINFNAFNIDCVFQWRFAPGSDLFIVWKNSILESGEQIIDSFGQNLNNTFESPQLNSLSLRLLYYVDFARLRRREG